MQMERVGKEKPFVLRKAPAGRGCKKSITEKTGAGEKNSSGKELVNVFKEMGIPDESRGAPQRPNEIVRRGNVRQEKHRGDGKSKDGRKATSAKKAAPTQEGGEISARKSLPGTKKRLPGEELGKRERGLGNAVKAAQSGL